MAPFHVRLGPFALSPVELFAFLGVVLAAVLSRRRMAEFGVSWTALWDLALAALVGGAVGARLFYFLPLWLRGIESGAHLVTRWSEGSGFYGGLVGGALGVALAARLRRLPVRRVLDGAAAPLPAGFAVGKLGCFFAGCCYGMRTDGFPGVSFSHGSLAWRTQRAAGEIPPEAPSALPVHPVALYELGLALLLFAALGGIARRSSRPGETALALAGGYSLWRFAIEFFRADPGRHGFGAGALSDSQVAAIVLLALAIGAWGALRLQPPAGTGPEPPK
jgi:phosphatidylglycerol:prolipoprotein diacylglycerol transferase